MERLIDINCNAFATGHDFVDFIEVEEVEAISAAFEARRPNGYEASFQLAPPLYYNLAHGIAATARVNDALLAAARRTGAFAASVVEPKFGDAALDEIDRVAGLGARSILWSARAQGVFINDHLMVELCRFASARGLVPMIHSAPFSVNESLERVWSLARKCDDVPMIVAGALASWENVQAIGDNRGGPENLFYELSGLATTWDLKSLIASGCTARLLFSSGGPRFLCEMLTTVADCKLFAEDRHAILSGNAETLFGLAVEALP